MTRKFPNVANPGMKIENNRTSADDDAHDDVFEQAAIAPRAAGFQGHRACTHRLTGYVTRHLRIPYSLRTSVFRRGQNGGQKRNLPVLMRALSGV